MERRTSRLIIPLGIVFLVICISAVTTAAVDTDSDSIYNGSQEDTDQAVGITYTVSPDGDTINNMTVAFQPTQQAFIQSDSYQITVSPGGADIDVQSQDDGTFFIPEIETGERVTFTFDIYPKTIKEEQINAVFVRLDYVQNGQDLFDTETVSADLSSSPWFELRSAEETVTQQRSELDRVSIVGQVTDVLFLGGIVAGFAGAGLGVFAWRRKNSERERLKREYAADLDRLAERMERRKDTKTLNERAEEMREDLSDSSVEGSWD